MRRVTGRNIYLTSLRKVLGKKGPAAFAARCRESQFSAVWLRLARGPALDKNFALPELNSVRSELDKVGVELWGWHVPFCADQDAAREESAKVVQWAEQYSLAGVLLDAERTNESPRFRGGKPEAKIYAEAVHAGLSAKGRGIALSSHDQPALHKDLPFDIFLAHVEDNCPQVYYSSSKVATRFNKSVRDYTPLETGRDFKDRFKPTGNITVRDDVRLPSAKICLAAAKAFISLVKTGGYHAYSFWCWDSAPAEIWKFFRETPV
jgi:hypothetical protein